MRRIKTFCHLPPYLVEPFVEGGEHGLLVGLGRVSSVAAQEDSENAGLGLGRLLTVTRVPKSLDPNLGKDAAIGARQAALRGGVQPYPRLGANHDLCVLPHAKLINAFQLFTTEVETVQTLDLP